jgi:3-dehydroquinate dehydratase type I
MICVSLSLRDPEEVIRILKSVDFAEVRLDLVTVDAADVQRIFSSPSRLIATCREGGRPEAERESLLKAAILAGAAYVDLDIQTDTSLGRSIIPLARSRNCKIILSFHDFEGTPARAELKRIIDLGFRSGADIVKIACQVNVPIENARLLGLLEDPRPLVVLGMGEPGRITRVFAPLLGGRFTYASSGVGKETAPGQLPFRKLIKLLEALKDV